MLRLKECVLTLLLCTSVLHANYYETVSYSLHLNDKVVTLENPLKKSESKTLFIPLQDLATLLNGNLDYNRKTDTYDFTIKTLNINCTLIPFSEDIIINKTPAKLSEKIRIIDGIPHASIPDFLARIGFLCTVSNNRVFIKSSSLKKTDLSTPISTSKAIPKFKYNDIVFLSIFGKKYDISKDILNENHAFYINLTPILKSFGFQVVENSKKVVLTFDEKTYTFIPQNKKEFIQNQGQYYINFEAFISKLGLDFIWTNETHEIMVLNKITGVKYLTEGDNKHIQIESKFPISYTKSTPTIFAQGYYFEFPSTTTLLPFTLSKSLQPQFPDYQITMPTPYIVRVSLMMPHTTILPFLISEKETLSISFNTILSELEQTISKNVSIITLKSSTPFKPQIKHFTNENKLVIDIPNAYNRLPQKLDSDSEFFSKIRTSQFSFTPLSTRIVCDLKESPFEISTNQTNSEVQIIFSKPSSSKPAPMLPSVSSKKQTQTLSSRKTKQTLLSDKIIVIDAGHGGRDPGAIVKNKYQEKEFTLDIAQNVQALLAKDGAFVILTRSNDSTLELNGRTDLANENKADLFVSIHLNSHFRSRTNGIESYYYKDGDKELASTIQKRLKSRLSLQDKGVKKARFFVLRNTDMPATLLEMGYLTNRRDFSKISDDKYRKKMAEAIYLGISDYIKENKND